MDKDKAIRAAKLTLGGMLEKKRHTTAVSRADGQVSPSKYLPNVPRQVHADGGKVAFMQGNHPDVPDVVYHGTNRDIRSFDPEAQRNYDIDPKRPDSTDTGWFGKGHYFAPRPKQASYYAEEAARRSQGKGAQVYPVHLSMKNPFVVNMRDSDSGATTLDKALNSAGVPMHPRGYRMPSEQTAALIGMGHDGVIAKREGKTEEIVAFHPNQIKSAIGNQGTFDPTDPDITKAAGGAANAPMFQDIHELLRSESGAPLDLYHGTTQPEEFEAFDDAKLGRRDAGFYGRGHYLTPEKDTADEYGEDGTVIGPLHAALKNPYVWDVSSDMKAHSTLRDLQSMGIMKEKSKLDFWDNLQSHHVQPFMAEMRKRGHDGVVVKTGAAHLPNGISEVVAFDPKTIKHTEAEAFDPTDPRIRREDGGEVDGGFEVGKKYNGVIPQIKYLPVRAIERQPSQYEVSRVSDDVAKNMDFSEPVEATAFRYGSNNSEDHPSVALQNGHHRLAAAHQTGRPHLPVTITAVNAKGEKLNALKKLSDEIERSMVTKADGGRVSYGNGGKSLGLYSKAAQIIRNQPQAKGSVDQLLAMVSKTKGVKPAELTNAGRPAGDTMTKEELAKHFDDALPKVDVERIGGRDSNGFPQYEEYTLPGGENYREHLLHLSDEREPPKALHRVMGAFPRDFDSEEGARQYIRQLDTMRNTPGMESIAESLTRYPAIYQRENGRSTNPNDFKSSHWGTPNVLAHVRMSDRDNGETLHVHEVQSDWGQEGREKGFHDPEKPFEVVNKKTKEVVSRHPDYSSMWDAYRTHPDSDNLTYGDVRDEKPPQGPYVGNTQQWTDLALKHVLMEAAKGGYKRVVFSPGEANADLYGQRKEVSKLEFLKSNDSGEAGILSGFTKNGYYSSQHDVESHADLPKLIGKENAAKLLAQPPTPSPDKGEDRYTHTLQGPLQVGGHGMVDYYKNYVNQGAMKLLQQHDQSAKPESYDLPEGYKGFALPVTDTARESILKNGFQAFQRGGEVHKADGGEVEKKRDFMRDNPGGEWLEGKRARAAQYPGDKFMIGATTGVIGGRSSMFLPTHVLKGIAGLNDEVRTTGVSKYDSLLSDAQKGGFDPEQKGNKVVVAVNHFGQPYLLEGNTRVAVAHSMGIPKVRAEVRYWNGAENVDGPMHPENVFSMASDSPDVAKATGGPVMGYVPMASLTAPKLAIARAPQYQQQAPVARFSESLNSLMDTVEGFKKKPELKDVQNKVDPSSARNTLTTTSGQNAGYDPSGMSEAANAAYAKLVDAYGQPLNVISTYRDPQKNQDVGGAKGSQHLHGNAYDIDVSNMSYEDRLALADLAWNSGFRGIGFYDNSLHFDVGDPRAWGPSYSRDSIPDWAQDWTENRYGYSGGGSAMDDDNQNTGDNSNVESLSLARSLRNIGSGGGDDRVQGLFEKIAAGQQQAQKAYEMAHSNGEFDDFKIGDTFVYKHSKYPTPMKVTGFSVSRAEAFPQRKRIYNNHVPVLEMENQDAEKKVNKYPVEWFQENLHKYDFVSGKPRAVKAGGGAMDDSGQNGAMENGNAPINFETRPQAGGFPNAGGVRGSSGVLQAQDEAPLEGLPTKIGIPLSGQSVTAGPDPRIRQVARDYMASTGMKYNPPTKYAKVDPIRARRIAAAYEGMKDDPNDPLTKASYDAMIKETMAQYNHAKKAGLKVEFWNPEKQEDPYGASPRLATEDVRKNHHMWVFPTYAGYGSGDPISEDDAKKNPLLQLTGETWNGIPVTVNDVFRAVHDYYGHAKEGVGFRADGEENAWRSHASMYSPLARMAMTSETRGQNSWLNYGPHGEKNRNARTEDTIFAPQKIGVMPHWAHHEGAEDFTLPEDVEAMQRIRSNFDPAVSKALALTRRFTKGGESAINTIKSKGK